MDKRDSEKVREAFRRFAEKKATGYSVTYTVLARHVIASDDLTAIAEEAKLQGSTVPDLFFFAVQYLARIRKEKALLSLFDSGTKDTETADAVKALDEFCQRNQSELRKVLHDARLQTNDPGRSAALLVGLIEAEKRYGGPLYVVDIGTSAGLHLMLDQLDYIFEADDGRLSKVETSRRRKGFQSPLVRTRLLNWSGRELPETMPSIRGKIGIDLEPLDVTKPDDQLRLESYIWPEERERRSFLRSVIALGAQDPPVVVQGDAAAELPGVLESIPDSYVVCLVNSHAVGQFPPTVIEEIDAITAPLLASGRCVKIALEGRKGGALPAPRMRSPQGSYAQLRITGRDGSTPLLLAGSHGGWIEAL